ncbi:uncharacterized protein [Dysidea avara]|uniref:uncharacterized protein n=1 Tax=Dysidea avara TaxID=196820 RepID=UPI003317FF7B
MGNCIKSNSAPDNEFEVYFISDARKLDRQDSRLRGLLRITDTKLLFTLKTDKSVKTEWQFEHIRKCGCNNDDNIFIIDAGSKCPIGKGTYIFNTEHAQELYDLFNEVVARKNQQSQTLDGANNATIEGSPGYEILNKPSNPTATDEEPTQPPDKEKTLSYPEIVIVNDAQSGNMNQPSKVSYDYSSIDLNKTDVLKEKTDGRKQREKVRPEKLQIEQDANNDDGPMRSPYVNVPDSPVAQQCMETDRDSTDEGKQKNKFIPAKLKIDEKEQETLSNDEPMPSPYVNMPESPYTKNYVEIDHKEKEETKEKESKPPAFTYNYSTVDEVATVALTKVKQDRDEEKEQKTLAKQDSNQTK